MNNPNCTKNILGFYPYGSWFGKNLIGYFQLIKELNDSGYAENSNFSLPTLSVECNYWQYDHSDFQHVTYLKYCAEDRYKSYCEVHSKPDDYYDPCKRVENGYKLVTNNNSLANNYSEYSENPEKYSGFLEDTRFNHLLATSVYQVPFCGFHHFGFDSEFYEDNSPNVFSLLPGKCQAGLVIISLILIVLAITITTMNIIVLIVMLKYMDKSTTQNWIKIGIAVSDLLQGSIAIPCSLAVQIVTYYNTWIQDEFLNCEPEGRFSFRFIDAAGFFQNFGFGTSFYLLMFGSIDRLLAIKKPLKYSTGDYHWFKYFAISFSLLVSFALAIYPVFAQGKFSYTITANLMFFAIGSEAMLVLGVFLVIPLLIQLVAGSIIILKIRKVFRRNLDGKKVEGSIEMREVTDTKNKEKKTQKQKREFRAAMTVSIMIGVFFLSVFPAMVQNVGRYGYIIVFRVTF